MKAIDKKAGEESDTPKITKNFITTRHPEASTDYSSLKTGLRTMLLSFVAKEKTESDPVLPPQAEENLFSVKHSSEVASVVCAAPCECPLHREGNSQSC